MNFRLASLSEAFQSAEFQASNKKFLLFCFILATRADENVFPDLLAHFSELHQLTSRYILVICPQVHIGWANEQPCSYETARVLRNGEYEGANVSQAIEDFLTNQTSEAIAFARFCGLAVDKLPCVLFFASLDKPEDYLIWPIKGQNAASFIGEYRTIVASVENASREVTELDDALLKTKRRHDSLAWEIERASRRSPDDDAEVRQYVRDIEYKQARLTRKLRGKAISYEANPQLSEQIEALQSSLITALRTFDRQLPYRLPLGRISRKLRELIARPFDLDRIGFVLQHVSTLSKVNEIFDSYVAIVQSQSVVERDEAHAVEQLNAEIADLQMKTADRRKLAADEIQTNIGEWKAACSELQEQMASVEHQRGSVVPDLLGVIHSLDRRRYVRKALRDLGKSIPILNFGLSFSKIFR